MGKCEEGFTCLTVIKTVVVVIVMVVAMMIWMVMLIVMVVMALFMFVTSFVGAWNVCNIGTTVVLVFMLASFLK